MDSGSTENSAPSEPVDTLPADTMNLPASGILYFFHDCSMDGMPWGFDPDDADGKVVYYYDGDLSRLERREAPENIEENGCVFGAARLTFETALGFLSMGAAPFGSTEVNKMTEMMIGFTICSIVGCSFIGLGIYSFFSKKAVGFWANAEKFEVTDRKKYNGAVAKLFFVFGFVFILLGLPLLSGQNSAWIVLSVVGAMVESITAMVIYTTVIEKKYRKKFPNTVKAEE